MINIICVLSYLHIHIYLCIREFYNFLNIPLIVVLFQVKFVSYKCVAVLSATVVVAVFAIGRSAV